MSNQHVLKIHPAPLADLLSGAKTAEVRCNDRGFQVGDTVALREVNPFNDVWTGRPYPVRTISHIQTGYGLPDGLCVLSYAQAEQQEAKPVAVEAQGAQAGEAPKVPPMGKLDIPARGVPLNECHSCGWLGGENEVPGEEDQCYCPNCRSDNIDDDVNLPRLFHLVRYLARAALATQPAAGEPVYQVEFLGLGGGGWHDVDRETMEARKAEPKHWNARTLWTVQPAAAHGDEAVQCAIKNLVAVARTIDKEAFAKGTQNVPHGHFRSLDYALQSYDAAIRAQGDGGCS